MREISEAWYKTIAVWVAAWVPALCGEGGDALKRPVVFEILCQTFFHLNSNLLLLLSVGLPVANAPDVLQPCGLLYYP